MSLKKQNRKRRVALGDLAGRLWWVKMGCMPFRAMRMHPVIR